MFEKLENITSKSEEKEKADHYNETKEREESTKETQKDDRYEKILEEAYQSGTPLDLPELEAHNTDEIDTESINEFSLAVIDFIEKKEQYADDEELKKLSKFVKELEWIPTLNLSGFFDLTDNLKLMTRATRSNVIQKTFGGYFIQKTIGGASQIETDLRRSTLKIMDGIPIAEQLDLLHQLRTVGARALSDNERVAYNQVRETYESLTYSADHSVFIQLAAEAGLETLKKERERPQLSHSLFGENISRLYSRYPDEQNETLTRKFFSKYDLDKVDPNEITVTPKAKDALVYRNRFGLATGVIKIDVESFLSDPNNELEFDVNQYRTYKKNMDAIEEDVRQIHKIPNIDEGTSEQINQEKQELTWKIFRAIHDEYIGKKIAAGDAKSSAKVFAEMLPALTEQEWEKYFIGEIRLREDPVLKNISNEFDQDYIETVNEFVSRVFQYREILGTPYAEEYNSLEKALERQDLDHARAIATDISMECMDRDQPSTSHQEIIRLRKKCEEKLEKNFEQTREKYESSNTELSQSEEIKEYNQIANKLENSSDEIHDQLRTFIEDKLAMAKDLPKLQPTTLKQLTAELKNKETSDKVTDEEALLFQHIHSSDLASKIEGEFGFSLSDLSLREQYFFLNYLKKIKPDSAGKMKQLTSVHGVDGMRTFLALERGNGTLGDDIVTFSQHTELANTVFKYYGELLNRAEKAETLVREISDHKDEVLAELSNQVRENIINRAQKDLERAVRAHDPSEVAKRLETYNVEAKEYVALLQEIGAGGIEITPSEEISSEDKEQMKHLLKENYNKTYPDPEDADFKTAVARSLEKSFSNPNTTFYILRDKDKIVSYSRFDTVKDQNGRENLYFGSFNADPAYNGVGNVMLEETTKKKLKEGKPITAHCDPSQDVTKRYIENGFFATEYFNFKGKPSFEIWRSENSNNQLESKNMSVEYLLNKNSNLGNIVVREKSETENYNELKDNLALTRYFTYQKTTYLVFEKLPDALKEDLSFTQEEQKQAA